MTPFAKRVFFVVGAVAMIVLFAGLSLAGRSSSNFVGAPVGLTFLGYTKATNGGVVANLQLTNVSGKPIHYTAGGSNVIVPTYILEIPPKNPKAGVYVPGTNNFFAPSWIINTDLELAPGGSVTFAVPMALGTSNVSIAVFYDQNDRPGVVKRMVESLQLLVMRHSSFSRRVDSVSLQLPAE